MTDPVEQVRCADCDFTTTVYPDEVRAFYRFHRCYPPAERAILRDLIAELRGLHANGDYYYRVPVDVLLDRAEARLRGQP